MENNKLFIVSLICLRLKEFGEEQKKQMVNLVLIKKEGLSISIIDSCYAQAGATLQVESGTLENCKSFANQDHNLFTAHPPCWAFWWITDSMCATCSRKGRIRAWKLLNSRLDGTLETSLQENLSVTWPIKLQG